MLLSLVVAIWAAFDNNAAINAFAISLALQGAIVHWMTSTIEVGEGELRIKRAHIPVKYLGEIEEISKEAQIPPHSLLQLFGYHAALKSR